MTSDSMTIGDDSVVSFHYKLRDDTGTFSESSEEGSPGEDSWMFSSRHCGKLRSSTVINARSRGIEPQRSQR